MSKLSKNKALAYAQKIIPQTVTDVVNFRNIVNFLEYCIQI